MIALAVNELVSTLGAAPRPPTPVARLVGIAKTYGRGDNAVAALTGASLDIHPGEVTLIEGPSGSGKTTLISILGLLLKPSGGEVVVSVDRHGRLMSLKLASGSTARFTYEALERLINDTLHAAVDLAARPDRQLVSA